VIHALSHCNSCALAVARGGRSEALALQPVLEKDMGVSLEYLDMCTRGRRQIVEQAVIVVVTRVTIATTRDERESYSW